MWVNAEQRVHLSSICCEAVSEKYLANGKDVFLSFMNLYHQGAVDRLYRCRLG